MKKIKLYECIGENFCDGWRVGYCGEIHSLNDWLNILFPGKNAVEYFKGDSDSYILEYIFNICGKRLKFYNYLGRTN